MFFSIGPLVMAQKASPFQMIEWAMVVAILLTASVYVFLWTQDELVSVIEHIFHEIELAPRQDY